MMSPTEIRLWRALQLRPEGFRFRRQHCAGPFVLDFYCRKAALAVEVDGMRHDFEVVALADECRDAMLRERGIATLRVPAEAVRDNLEGVVVQIVERCLERTPPPRGARSPSPSNDGEDA